MNRFRFATTSVRGRILAGFAFIILLVIGITVAGYIQLNQVRAASTEIVPTSAQIEQLQDFALALTAYQGDLDRYFTIGGQEFREAILTDLDNMESISAALQAETDSPDLVRLVEEEEFLRTESLIILDTENSGLTGTQINLKIIELYRRVDTITELHEGLTDQALTQMRGTADTQQGIISRVLTQFAVLGVVITVVAVAAVAIVTRILAPIGTLTEVALDISGGNLERTAPVESSDELGTLAKAFNSMTSQLRELIGSLEQRVQTRTQALEASAEVSRQLSTILDQEALVTAVVEQVQKAFNYYHAHIYLLDETGQKLVMAGGTGKAGQAMLADGHSIAVGQGLVGRAAATQDTVLVPDVSQEEGWLPNPLLPDTKAETAVPIAIGDAVLGVLDVQQNSVDSLEQQDVELLESIASQVAIALQNARQYDEVQRSQRSIQEREALLRTIIDSTPDWIFVKDLEHRYLMVNQGYANSFHMTPDDFIGQNDLDIGFSEAIVKGDPEKGIRGLWADDREIMERGELTVIDAELAEVDGEERFLNTIKAPLKDSAGNVTGVVGFVHDITDRIRTEEAVRERETLLRTIIDSTPDWIFVKDLEHRYLMVNQEYANSFHMTPDDFIGQNDLDIGFPEEIVKGNPEKGIRGFWADDREIMERGELKVIDAELAEVDGEERFLNTIKAPLKDSAGNVTGVVGFVHDITSLKQIEVALQNAQDRAQETLESITVPLVISRIADGIVAYVNDPMAEVIRVPRDELIGQVTPDFYEDPAKREGYLAALREHGKVANYDLRLKRGDGDLFWALISGRVIDYQGEPAIITSVMDINERREAQALVARRALELETVADVGTVAATILEPDELLQQVVELTKERFNLYHAHIYLLDEDKTALTLTNGAGEVGRTMVAEGRQIALSQEQSLVARAARTRGGVIINDVQAESGFLPHPLLPDTRAEMAVPFIAGQQVLGVLDVQADRVNRFSAEDISIFATLASQVAVALQNARRYDEAQRALDDLSRLQRIMAREGWEAFLLDQERPLSGFTFDGKGAKPITSNSNEVPTVTETDGDASGTGVATAVTVPKSLVSIPIGVGGEMIGQLGLRNPDGSPISARKQALLQTVSQQVSEALERARLSEQTQMALAETQERANELTLLNQVVSDVSASLDIEQSLQVVANELAKATGVDGVGIALIDSDQNSLTVVAEHYDSEYVDSSLGYVIPIEGNALTQEVLKTRQTVVVEDAQNNPLTKPVHDGMRMRGVNALYVIPMFAGNDIIGTVGLDIAEKDRLLLPEQIRLAETLVFQAATAVQNARLFAESKERTQQLAVLNEVAHVVSHQLEPDQLFAAVHEQIQRVIFNDAFFVAIYDEEKQLVHLPYTFDDGQVYEEESIPADPAIEVVQVIQTGEPILVNYTPEEHAHEQATNETLMGTMKAPSAMLFVPLRSGSKIMGAISVQNYQFRPYTEADQTLLLGIASHLAVAMENARLFTQTEQRAAELSIINAVSELASSQLELSSLFTSVGELLQKTFAAENIYFALHNKKAGMIAFPYFASKEEGFLDVAPHSIKEESYTSQIIAARGSLLRVMESETPGEQMQAEGAQLAGNNRNTDCYLGTPMIVGNEVIGVVGLSSYREVRIYNEQDQRLLETLADTIGVAIQNIRQFEDAQRRAQQEQMLRQITQRIRSSADVETIMRTAVQEIGRTLGRKTYIYLGDEHEA